MHEFKVDSPFFDGEFLFQEGGSYAVAAGDLGRVFPSRFKP